jgi:hypothetical protein
MKWKRKPDVCREWFIRQTPSVVAAMKAEVIYRTWDYQLLPVSKFFEHESDMQHYNGQSTLFHLSFRDEYR